MLIDVSSSRKLITNLADYLRGSFQFGNIQKRVPLVDELTLIQSYIEIEKVRFKERLHIEYEIDAEAVHILIPPLLLQPLVENAIRHGIGQRLEGGTIWIRAIREKDYYLLQIEDNGVGISDEKEVALLPTTGVALRNIRKRLKYAFGTELEIESAGGKGTKVTVCIPLESAAG